MTICKLDGCNKQPQPYRTICSMHLRRKAIHGDYNYVSRKMPSKGELDKFINEWIELYNGGMHGSQIAKKYSVHSSTIYNHLKLSGVDIRSKSESKMSEQNPMWKADRVNYSGLHLWVKQRLPKPDVCQDCKTAPPLDLANISNSYNPDTYNRDLKNWEWLCRKCHMVKDGRLSRLYHAGMKPKYFGCLVDGCSSKHGAKGYCDNHYAKRAYRLKKGLPCDY